MKYEGLAQDFENIRETQEYAVRKVIDEAQKYIEHLEGKEDLLENLLVFINEINDSFKNETKQEILEGLKKILPYE